jgi:hypothetical protein
MYVLVDFFSDGLSCLKCLCSDVKYVRRLRLMGFWSCYDVFSFTYVSVGFNCYNAMVYVCFQLYEVRDALFSVLSIEDSG